MKVKYKEDPRAWRKSALLSALGLALLSSLLRWRHVLTSGFWLTALFLLACTAAIAWLRPAWFRSYYRFSAWSGFWSSQCVVRGFLALIFAVLIFPAAVLLRLLGKDLLRLKRSSSQSYWNSARPSGPLDRLF